MLSIILFGILVIFQINCNIIKFEDEDKKGGFLNGKNVLVINIVYRNKHTKNSLEKFTFYFFFPFPLFETVSFSNWKRSISNSIAKKTKEHLNSSELPKEHKVFSIQCGC